MTPQVSDLSLPHLGRLRELCIERLKRKPLEPWGHREFNIACYLLGKEDGQRVGREYREPHKIDLSDEPLVRMVGRDLEDYELPKWVLLVSWLSPEGLGAHYPQTVGIIAKYALGMDVSEIETQIPRKVLDY